MFMQRALESVKCDRILATHRLSRPALNSDNTIQYKRRIIICDAKSKTFSYAKIPERNISMFIKIYLSFVQL